MLFEGQRDGRCSGHVTGFCGFSGAAYRSLLIRAVLARQFEQASELDELMLIEMAQQLFRHAGDLIVHPAEKVESGGRDLGPDHSSIAFVALLPDKLQDLHSPQETGNVRFCGDHAFADGTAGEPLRDRPAQDAEDVVLRTGYAPMPSPALDSPLKAV